MILIERFEQFAHAHCPADVAYFVIEIVAKMWVQRRFVCL